jgi:hypothetical protein
MESAPVTLGDWFEILKPSDYAEAAMLVNDGGHAPPWIPTFLMHWAPELINGRARWERAEKRKLVLDQLAIIELAAQQLTDAIDSEIIKYLQLPPHPRFESELGVRIPAFPRRPVGSLRSGWANETELCSIIYCCLRLALKHEQSGFRRRVGQNTK